MPQVRQKTKPKMLMITQRRTLNLEFAALGKQASAPQLQHHPGICSSGLVILIRNKEDPWLTHVISMAGL